MSTEIVFRTYPVDFDLPDFGPITVDMFNVDSSQISARGHHADSNTLVIEFRPKPGAERGALYRYANVDAAFYKQFAEAKSTGSFFYKNIKPNADLYPYVKMEADQPAEPEAQQSAGDQQAA